jgi:hypothetical protein
MLCGRFFVRAGRVYSWEDEPKAAAGQGLDIARAFRLVAQRLPQLLDGGADAVVELDDRAIRPDAIADFLPRHHFSGMLEQHEENLERLFLQTNAPSALAQFARADVQLKPAKADSLCGNVDLAGCECSQSITPAHLPLIQSQADPFPG